MFLQRCSLTLFNLILPLLFLPTALFAAQASFSWLPNGEANLAGYKIHYSTTSREYTEVLDVGLPTPLNGRTWATIDGLTEGHTYYFAATAYDSAGNENSYSDEVVYTVPSGTVDLPPTVADSTVTGPEDTPINGSLLADNPGGSPLHYAMSASPTFGAVTVDATTGEFSYTPQPDFNGADSFTYTASNDYGASAPATVAITVAPVNDLPVAANGSFSTSEDIVFNGQLNGNDIDGQTLNYFLVSQPAKGNIVLLADGSFTYTPSTNLNGPDAFTFKVNDGTADSATANATIIINPVNDLPVAGNSTLTVQEDNPASGQLTGSDADGDNLSYTLASAPAKGSLVMDTTGTFTYTPDAEVHGEDSFSFTINDGTSDSNSAVVSISITPVNDPPVASAASFSVQDNEAFSGRLTASDPENDPLTFSLTGQPGQGTVALNADGTFTYTPGQNPAESDSFTFAVSDGLNSSSATTVLLTISPAAEGLQMEIGEIEVDSNWQHITLYEHFTAPVIVAKATNRTDPYAGEIRIRNVTANGFDIRFQEWDYLDDQHLTEMVTFLAMEKGTHQVDENSKVEAGCIELNGHENFSTITFSQSFSRLPVVLSSVTSNNDSDTVTLRNRNVTTTGFEMAQQEQEDSDNLHAMESACFIAWEQSAGIVDGIMFEATVTETSLTDAGSTINLQQSFPEIPLTLSDAQTANGMNTALLSQGGVTLQGISMLIAEEQSADTELGHIEEAGGYLALVPYDPQEDPDQDGLTSDEELQIFGTHPGLIDSDDDGIADGAEAQYWQDRGLHVATDSDSDGTINLLDQDSDDDGYTDGVECMEGSDPADKFSFPGTIPMEMGEIELGNTPVRVNFSQQYNQPVIVADLSTNTNSDPAVLRIQAVDSTGFTIEIQEYGYLDNIQNTTETVSYIVIEKGVYTLDNGAKVKAGTFDTSATSFTWQSLAGDLSSVPVVLTSTLTKNELDTVTVRIKNITAAGFDYKLQEQEVNSKTHSMETVAYIAWEPGTGTHNGLRYEVGRTPDTIKHKAYQINYNMQFSAKPVQLAGMQTSDGGDTATLTTTITSTTGMEVFVEEERSRDSEINHTSEVGGFFALSAE